MRDTVSPQVQFVEAATGSARGAVAVVLSGLSRSRMIAGTRGIGVSGIMLCDLVMSPTGGVRAADARTPFRCG